MIKFLYNFYNNFVSVIKVSIIFYKLFRPFFKRLFIMKFHKVIIFTLVIKTIIEYIFLLLYFYRKEIFVLMCEIGCIIIGLALLKHYFIPSMFWIKPLFFLCLSVLGFKKTYNKFFLYIYFALYIYIIALLLFFLIFLPHNIPGSF